MGTLGKVKQMKGRRDSAGFLVSPCLCFGVAELPAGTQPGSASPDLLAAPGCWTAAASCDYSTSFQQRVSLLTEGYLFWSFVMLGFTDTLNATHAMDRNIFFLNGRIKLLDYIFWKKTDLIFLTHTVDFLYSYYHVQIKDGLNWYIGIYL